MILGTGSHTSVLIRPVKIIIQMPGISLELCDSEATMPYCFFRAIGKEFPRNQAIMHHHVILGTCAAVSWRTCVAPAWRGGLNTPIPGTFKAEWGYKFADVRRITLRTTDGNIFWINYLLKFLAAAVAMKLKNRHFSPFLLLKLISLAWNLYGYSIRKSWI